LLLDEFGIQKGSGVTYGFIGTHGLRSVGVCDGPVDAAELGLEACCRVLQVCAYPIRKLVLAFDTHLRRWGAAELPRHVSRARLQLGCCKS
jgi:hypothetical protein